MFGADAVEFAGFEITMDTVRPCKRYLDVIRDFPTPTSITDVRSWFGLINQVHLHSQQQIECSHFVRSSNQAHHSSGTMNWTKSSKNPNLLSAARSKKASEYLTKQSPHASPRIGPGTESDTGCSKNIATTHQHNPFAALPVGV